MSASKVSFHDLNIVIGNLPNEYLTVKCTSDNPTITRNVKNLTIPQVRDLKVKLEAELEQFEQLYKKHEDIDKDCVGLIRMEMSSFSSDLKAKDTFKSLRARFDLALKDTCSSFLIACDYSKDVSSVKGRELYQFIIKYHRHKCVFTNHFHQCRGDTKKEIHRLQTILNHHEKQPHRDDSTDEEDVSTTVSESDDVKQLRAQIMALDIEEEEW